MMKLLSVFVVCASAVMAQAQSLPDRYMVSGVAADDVLNIRADPDSSSDIIGAFRPFALNVEILREQDGWGYTGAGERSGWVYMRYLEANPLPETELPRPLSCFGTEPFWDISFYPRGAEYNAMGEGRRDLTILREEVASNGFVVEVQEGPTLTRTLIISGLACNDGMSDRDFGLSLSMFTSAPDGNYVSTGCCTMQVN